MNQASMLRKSKSHRTAVAALSFRFDQLVDAVVSVPMGYMANNSAKGLRHLFPDNVSIKCVARQFTDAGSYVTEVHIKKRSRLNLDLPAGFTVRQKTVK